MQRMKKRATPFRFGLMNNPAPAQIKQARKDAGLTQTAAADLIYKSCRAWQQYEKGDRAMDLALFELFMIKVEKCK